MKQRRFTINFPVKVVSLILGLLFLGPAPAFQLFSQTCPDFFDYTSVPGGTVVDGLTLGNVTYGFEVGGAPSTDCTVAGGPGTIVNVQDPSVEGDASGTLILNFTIPVAQVTYGFALSAFTPSAAGSTLVLYNASNAVIGTFSSPAGDQGFGLVEGQVTSMANLAVRAEITFDNSNASRFAFDNLFIDCDICTPPTALTFTGVTQTTATIQWTATSQGSVTDHCWNVSVGGIGFDPTDGTAIFTATICEGDAGVNIAGSTVTYTVPGLQPGTTYTYCISETCDGMAPPNNVSGWECLAGSFTTFDDNFTLAPGVITPATCPTVSPGFIPDGSFEVVVSDGSSCTGTYAVTVISGPFPVTPNTYPSVPQGTYSFADAGPGTYVVQVTDDGGCNPEFNPVNINIVVPEGVDAQDPFFTVVDILGNIVVDSGTPTVNVGTVIIPEGSCSYQQELFAVGTDNCDGQIIAANALSASAVTTPATINPGTQVGVTTDGFGFYRIDINWSTGTSTVSIVGSDASGNTADLAITATVDDNVNPSVTIVGANNVTIPACAATRDIVVTVYVDDGCDQSVTINNLTPNFGGNPFFLNFNGGDYFEYVVTVGPEDDGDIWSAVYTDFFGNVGFADVEITVQQAAEDMPPVIIAADENLLVPVCADGAHYHYSFQILDDCDPIDVNAISFDDGGADLEITYVNNDPANNSAFIEVSPINFTTAPGEYILTIQYGGTLVDPLLVIESQPDQDPTIVLPGNLNFTIPVCQADLTTTFSITISDDCDDPINAGNANFFLGGTPITPTFTNAGAGYFEFTETLDPTNNGDLLLATYTDGGGNTTAVDALITVTDQPDNWAPIVIYPSQDINVELDPCAPPSATIFFEVTATDNCDGDIDPTVSVNPVQGVTNAIILPSLGGDTYVLVAEPGAYQVVVEATDAAGNTREEDFFVVITQDPAPQTNLACNNNINVTLNDQCEAVLVADLLLDGNFGCLTDADFEIVVVDSDITNGPIVDGPGTYNYEISLGGSAGIFGFTGPFAAQNWDVIEIGGPFGDDIVTITPDLATLVSGGNGCSMSTTMPNSGTLSFDYDYIIEDDIIMDVFLVDINGNNIININTGSGSGSVEVDVEAGWVLVIAIDGDGFQTGGVDTEIEITNFALTGALGGDPGDFTTCWGTLTAEDKTDPTIDCPDDTDQATVTQAVQFFQGALETTDAQIETVNYSCFLDAFNPPAGLHYYDLYTFSVTQADIYTFDGLTTWNDGAMALFQGAFNPDDPCQNIIAYSDDAFAVGQAPFDPLFRLALPLQPGQTYTLLVTSWPDGQTGDYSVAVYSDGTGQVTGLPVQLETFTRDLICTDFDEVFNNAESVEFVGTPVTADNCTNPTPFTFDDAYLENGDCGEVVIIRTFVTEDAAGRTATCSQQITFRKPDLADVNLPPFTVFLECDEGFPLDANGNPSPDVTGYPFVQTAFNVVDLNEAYCNLAATYEDGNPIVVCEGTYKLTRQWTVLDWCNPGASFFYNQIIKVGDNTGPTVTCPQEDYDWDGVPDLLTFSTGPFGCTAAFEVPLPEVTDNCSSFEILTEVVTDIEVEDTDQYGQVIGSHLETIVVATIQPGMSRYVAGIPVGQHRFRYTVTDDCGNETVVECDFQVTDQVEPVAICNEDLNISVSAEGYARVYAEDMDEGSWDNCGPVRLEVRRLIDEDESCNPIPPFYTAWGDFVEFDCCDVADMVTIELRVWDDANQDGVIGGPGDLFNVCWLEVLVEDKVVPVCVPPEQVTLDCNEAPYDLDPYDINQLQDLFGDAVAQDNCSANWQELSPVVNLSDCGFGTINRRFRAVDHYGNVSVNTCQQVITFNEVHDYEIKFPRDAEANCDAPVVDTLEYSEIGCDLLAVSSEDEFFSASGDECYKIFRTYRVINWCEYDGESDPVVISRDEDCDGNPGDEDIWVLVRPNGVTYFDRDNDENNNNPFAFSKGTSCDGLTNPQGHWINSTFDANATIDPITGQIDVTNPGESLSIDVVRDIASRGYWEYTQHIKVYDNIVPEIAVGDFDPFCSLDNVDCDGPVDIPFAVEENCTPDDVEVKEVFLDAFYNGGNFIPDFTLADGAYSVTGTYPNYNLVSDGLPIGSHAFEIHVKDGCGNTNSVLVLFEVVDCKAPTPICINGLSIELMPTEPGTDADGDGDIDLGAMAIWASDFIASPVTDCSEVVAYSINFAGQTPDINQDGLVLTCGNIGITIVEIHAWDGAGNNDFCETFVDVQDNMFGLCIGHGSIAGTIMTEQQNGVEDVEVRLSGNIISTDNTNNDGDYAFGTLEAGYDYSVQPFLNVDHFNGVSTLDLVLISRHILGTQPLASPYRRLAADVNNSATITTLDLIQARKGILGLIDEYPNNTSWRFVDAAYVFPDLLDPWSAPIPEVLNFNDLTTEVLDADFVAVKIGDVNGTASYNSLLNTEERDLAGTFTMKVAEQNLRSGETYTVVVSAPAINDVQGYQFTLDLDLAAVELLEIQNGLAREEHFGLRFADEGLLTTSWHRTSEVLAEASGEEVLFSLVLKGKKDVKLSEVLRVSSRYTVAEAYNRSDELLAVAIDFTGSATAERPSKDFALYQNTPNPFSEETQIGFELPWATQVTLKVYDVNGRVLRLVRLEGVKGYNQIALNAAELASPAGGSGVFYYTLETNDNTATRKMIRIE